MTSSASRFKLRALPFIVGGPVAIGAALGISGGVISMLHGAMVLPAIVVGIVLLMMPALYIGTAFTGVAPGAGAMLRSTTAALKDQGIIFLGLAPSLLFLVASSTEEATVRVLGNLAVGLGVVLGFRALYVRLFDQRSLRALALFLGWSIVAFGIGAQLFSGWEGSVALVSDVVAMKGE